LFYSFYSLNLPYVLICFRQSGTTAVLQRNFLLRVARDHTLSSAQEEVFCLRLGEGKSYEEIANQLDTSTAACIKCMGEVYKKFGIVGRGRGKELKLKSLLFQQYEQSGASALSVSELHKSEQLNNSSTYRQLSTLVSSLDNPTEWLDSLQQKLYSRHPVQQVLSEFVALLPRVIERTAASSPRTEREIMSEMIEQLKSILQIQEFPEIEVENNRNHQSPEIKTNSSRTKSQN
jgi:DNA-binding CsgD family transcriptional regulator